MNEMLDYPAYSSEGKWNPLSILAFSSLSEPWTAFLPIDSAYLALIVPSAASDGLVAPIKVLKSATAFYFSNTADTIGPEVIYSTNSP